MRRLGLLALVLFVGGCGGAKTATATSSSTTKATVGSHVPESAEDVLAIFQAKGLPIAETIDYSAATDPNHLLGRPHGYTSKVAWHDTRTEMTDSVNTLGSNDGGTVEFFDNADDAKSRYDYVDNIQKSVGALSGNDYQYLHGTYVMRIAGKLTPDQAKQYDAALG
jgi:hypothetical protein